MLTSAIDTLRQRLDELTAAQRLLEHLLSCPHPDPVRDCTYLQAELEETVAAAVENG